MKGIRHTKIIELIQNHRIETQEELADYLRKEGFQVTQATVSRDIRNLKLTKQPGENGKQYYAIHSSISGDLSPKAIEQNDDKHIRILRGAYLSSALAGNILVIKTSAGMASAVCAIIDAMNWDEIVGSIAGDDTIMCAVKTELDAQTVIVRLQQLIDFKK